MRYSLTAKMSPATIPVENESQPSLVVNDTLLYNNSLIPERIELQRGDEWHVNFNNQLPKDPCSATVTTNCLPERFGNLVSADVASHGMTASMSNIHSHGLVTPWDFKNSDKVRGDNVLTTAIEPRKRIAMTAGYLIVILRGVAIITWKTSPTLAVHPRITLGYFWSMAKYSPA